MNESRAGRYFNSNGFIPKDVSKFLPVGFNPNGLTNLKPSNLLRLPNVNVIRNPHQNLALMSDQVGGLAQLVKGSMRHPNNVLGNFM
jgi:hypothetical protein|tara:strand:+ start:3216 stop:3476 length:261 start_codon:yes stop_codon:yes gene_type:complete